MGIPNNSVPVRRALALIERPDIQDWIKRLESVVAETPKDVWVFVAAGSVCVMAKREDGKPYMREDYSNAASETGVVQDAKICGLMPRESHWDGGDW